MTADIILTHALELQRENTLSVQSNQITPALQPSPGEAVWNVRSSSPPFGAAAHKVQTQGENGAKMALNHLCTLWILGSCRPTCPTQKLEQPQRLLKIIAAYQSCLSAVTLCSARGDRDTPTPLPACTYSWRLHWRLQEEKCRIIMQAWPKLCLCWGNSSLVTLGTFRAPKHQLKWQIGARAGDRISPSVF